VDQPHGTWSHNVITATLVMFSVTWATIMLVGLPTFVIRQYTDLICVLEEHPDHTMLNMTVALIIFLLQEHLLDQLVQPTESVVNTCAWVTWPAVQHTQLSQVVVAQAMQLHQLVHVGAALAPVALLE